MKAQPRISIAALLLLTVFSACASPPQSALPATGVAADFYRWYIESLARDRDPFTQDRVTLKKYVSQALIEELDRRIGSPDGPEADYFIQAQDYLDEWVNDVTVVPVQGVGGTATVTVTLGAKSGSPYRLRVVLGKAQDSWKITKVQRFRG
jgi:hypothetical protein